MEIPGMAPDTDLDRAGGRAIRAEGCLLASATGDALGWPVEPRGNRVGGTRDLEPSLEFVAWDRREGGRFAPFVRHVPAGTYSDDTQLTLAVARSVLCGEDWWSHFTQAELPVWTLYELGGGGAVTRAAKHWEKGTPPWSGDLKLTDRRRYFHAGGNGAVMRIAPHAIAAADDATFALAAARIMADGATTHGHPRALVGALTVGYALWRAMRWKGKFNYGELIDETLRNSTDWMGVPEIDMWAGDWRASADHSLDADYISIWDRTVEEMIGLLESARAAIQRGSLARDSEVLEALGAFQKDGSAGTRTAAVALYFASRYVAQPTAGLLASAYARRTDADTIAATTGALLGAMTGADWLKPVTVGLQDASYIRRIAAELMKGAESQRRWEVSPARDLRRRVFKMLEGIDSQRDVDLPVFGRTRLEWIEEHPTESANLIRTWWLDTQEGQRIAITRIRKIPKDQQAELPEAVPQEEKTAASPRVDVYWFALPVKDLDRSLDFYRDMLRLQPTRATNTFVRFGHNLILQRETHLLDVDRPREKFSSGIESAGLVILLEEELFKEVRDLLKRNGISVTEETNAGRIVRLCLQDPDGHKVQIQSRASQGPRPVPA